VVLTRNIYISFSLEPLFLLCRRTTTKETKETKETKKMPANEVTGERSTKAQGFEISLLFRFRDEKPPYKGQDMHRR
jgi:hypothetical protein